MTTDAYRTRPEFDDAVASATEAAAAYYDTGTVLMSDAEYDNIVDRVEASLALNPWWDTNDAMNLVRQVAGGASSGGDVSHPHLMGSLEKAKTLDDVAKFLDTLTGPVVVEPKLDGLAIRAEYRGGSLVLLATRGDGMTGEDVTGNAGLISGLPSVIPFSGDLEVRGEVFMTDADFDASNAARTGFGKAAFANPRNAVAGSLRKVDSEYSVQMSFAAYDVYPDAAIGTDHVETMTLLESWGIRSASGLIDSKLLTSGSEVEAAIAALGARRDTLGFPIDGAVVKAARFEDRAGLGMATRAPRWAAAYKYAPNEATTTLLGIEVGVGRTGRITLRAVLDPVPVGGTTVTYATLHNPAFIEQQGLAIGQKVMVVRAGDVIPRVTAAVGEQPAGLTPWHTPATCPDCGDPWDTSSLLWRCTTAECSTVGRITYAAARDCLDIMGMSEAIATALVEAGAVNDVADLFYLDVATLSAVVLGKTSTGADRRVGEATAAKIVAEIEKAKSQPLARVITALGIRKTGRTMGRRIASALGSMDALIAADEQVLSEIDGIGPEKAAVIVAEVAAMRPVIERLRAAGVTMTGETVAAAELPLAGKTVVVTGAMTGALAPYGRNEMNELIEANGGKASGSVSARTVYLVASDRTTSKAKKAADLGVEVLSPEQFARIIGIE
jgi:DNA ligase (NAD+)